jgi:hypothetical protein
MPWLKTALYWIFQVPVKADHDQKQIENLYLDRPQKTNTFASAHLPQVSTLMEIP